MELQAALDRVRAAIPEDERHRWTVPEGRDGVPGLPPGLAALYRCAYAPHLGDMVFHPAEEVRPAKDVAAEFGEWGLEVDEPRAWVEIGTCAGTFVYENTERGTVAVIKADDLREGRMRLRELAPDTVAFCREYVLGARYPLITVDPVAEHVPPLEYDDWIPVLEAAGLVEPGETTRLMDEWAALYTEPVRPSYAPVASPADDSAEAVVAAKLARLGEVGLDLLLSTGAIDEWDDLIGFGYDPGVPVAYFTDATEQLRRLYALVGYAHLGAVQLSAEEAAANATAKLPKTFAKAGLDAAEAGPWFAIGEYFEKGLLLLHRENGRVAGLEPKRPGLRHLHDDLFGFLNRYALGAHQAELAFDPGAGRKRKAAEQWTAFLTVCGIDIDEGAESA